MARRRFFLTVIDEPSADSGRTILDLQEGAHLHGGDDDLLCGSCGKLLAGLSLNQVHNVVMRCPGCGSYNDTLGS